MSLVKTMTVGATPGRVLRHRPVQHLGWSGVAAHPNSPAGGCGPGFSRSARPLGQESGNSDPQAPAGRFLAHAHEQAKVEIEFGPNARRSAVSNYTLQVLEHILQTAGETGATITSTARSADDQARAMFDNLEKYGVARQKRLYGQAGNRVIDAYAAAKADHEPKEKILADMEDTINEIGPSKVSNHAANPLRLGVIDIAPSSIWHKDRFIKAVQAEPRVARFLQPPADPAFHLEIPQRTVQVIPDTPAAPPPLPSKKPKEKTWVEFRVVVDQTSEPVAGVKLRIMLPNGIEDFYFTDSEGEVRIEECDPGTCTAKCDCKGAKLSSTLDFVGLGERRGSGKKPAYSREIQAETIASVKRHKVSSKDTLESIAKANGMSSTDLALFNWGTSDPEEINEQMQKSVGCTRKSKDRLSYVFDDSDEPGIIYVPREWKEASLATEKTHIIRVAPRLDLVLKLADDAGHAIPEAEYQIAFFDGTTRSGRLGRSGAALLADPPEGPFAVVYPGSDDILAKSLAASMRQAFDDRSSDEVLRLLQHPPQTINQAIKAYDQYFNDYNGKGLIEDIYQEFTDPEALTLIEGMMAYNELAVRGDVKILQRLEIVEETQEKADG